MSSDHEFRVRGQHTGEGQTMECVTCGKELQDQRDSLMYECERCINLQEE